jgi:hypothetical protein
VAPVLAAMLPVNTGTVNVPEAAEVILPVEAAIVPV